MFCPGIVSQRVLVPSIPISLISVSRTKSSLWGGWWIVFLQNVSGDTRLRRDIDASDWGSLRYTMCYRLCNNRTWKVGPSISHWTPVSWPLLWFVAQILSWHLRLCSVAHPRFVFHAHTRAHTPTTVSSSVSLHTNATSSPHMIASCADEYARCVFRRTVNAVEFTRRSLMHPWGIDRMFSTLYLITILPYIIKFHTYCYQ